MAVSKIGTGSWYSSLAEQTYDSEVAAKHYDNLERMRSRPESEGSKLLDSLTAAQIRSLHDELNVEAEAVQGNLNWKQVQLDFVAGHPDYLAVPTNGAALSAVLLERGKLLATGVFLGTLADVDAAYVDLAQRGVLELRKGAPMPQNAFDPVEAYAMPLDELERRARGW